MYVNHSKGGLVCFRGSRSDFVPLNELRSLESIGDELSSEISRKRSHAAERYTEKTKRSRRLTIKSGLSRTVTIVVGKEVRTHDS
jgi:hypothetical protein